jgi:tetratricopeptide (TPR) repeat protein
MPVSKKPRAKRTAAPAPSKLRVGTPALPDRRTMESFLAALGGRGGDGPTARAQDVMYEAWEETTTRSRIALAHKALSISPLCADAYVLLADEAAQTVEEARDYYAKGIEAGELALGPEGFAEYEGHFWGFLETRPYMRARAGLASALSKLGDVDGAIGHFRDMLRLNPNDNQGIRYLLAGCLLRRGDDDALEKLLASYKNEGSAFWLYTRALLAFREGGDSDKRAAALVREASAANEHVPAILAGTTPPMPSENGYITLGGPDEATEYVAECGPAWHRTPGAVAWLSKTVNTSSSKRRTRPNAH